MKSSSVDPRPWRNRLRRSSFARTLTVLALSAFASLANPAAFAVNNVTIGGTANVNGDGVFGDDILGNISSGLY
ncbi:MAG TPA: hypothetical protein VEQ65_06275, partial [Opitutus sp.]|nr:hypothetical protein [Opitutus sp.]